jgi:hypothetical protein
MILKMPGRTLTLILRTEDGRPHDCVLEEGRPFVIGRGKETDLRLDFKSVSRQHCHLELGATGGIEVVDLGSQNGTRLNGKRIDRGMVRIGDELLVATVPLRVEPGGVSFDASWVEAKRKAPERDQTPSQSEKQLRAQLEDMGLEILERIDLGSPVPVYKAHRTDLEQDVSVKAVRFEEDGEGAGDALRLLREAKLAAKMRHRNIAQVYDVRQSHGVVAIVFESVEGRTLLQEIHRAGEAGLDPGRALHIGVELCSALQHAHALGIVHRNITPTTVMVTNQGEVKLVDFGLAKSMHVVKGPQLTRTGQQLGAVEYAPPEQVRDASGVDHRADIYAVGSTLYHALAGEPPLIQVNPEKPDDPTADVPALLEDVAPRVPEAARQVVDRAMRMNPAERYPTAEAMRHALEGAIALLEASSAVMQKLETVEVAVARMAGSGQSGTTGFLGRIQADELIELLQMVEHNRKGGLLEISGTPDANGRRLQGTIAFREGQIVEARAGEHRGREALFELLLLPSGNFRVIFGDARAVEEETPMNISATLMELLHRKDESTRRHAEEERTPPPPAVSRTPAPGKTPPPAPPAQRGWDIRQ